MLGFFVLFFTSLLNCKASPPKILCQWFCILNIPPLVIKSSGKNPNPVSCLTELLRGSLKTEREEKERRCCWSSLSLKCLSVALHLPVQWLFTLIPDLEPELDSDSGLEERLGGMSLREIGVRADNSSNVIAVWDLSTSLHKLSATAHLQQGDKRNGADGRKRKRRRETEHPLLFLSSEEEEEEEEERREGGISVRMLSLLSLSLHFCLSVCFSGWELCLSMLRELITN